MPEGLGFLADILNVRLRVISGVELEVFLSQLMAELANNHSHLVVLAHTFGINPVLELPRDRVARVSWEEVDAAGVEGATAVLSVYVLLISLEKLVQ